MDKERIRLAKAKLLREPFNVDSWEVVAKDAQSKKIDDSRKTFESIIENFPTSGKFWKMYIEQEVRLIESRIWLLSSLLEQFC